MLPERKESVKKTAFELKADIDSADEDIEQGNPGKAIQKLGRVLSVLKPGRVADSLSIRAAKSSMKMFVGLDRSDQAELVREMMKANPEAFSEVLKRKIDMDPAFRAYLEQKMREKGYDI